MDLARANAGKSSAAKMAMIATTTDNSIKVKPELRLNQPGESRRKPGPDLIIGSCRTGFLPFRVAACQTYVISGELSKNNLR